MQPLPPNEAIDAKASLLAAVGTLTFRDWTGDRDPCSIGTNVGCPALPFQRWRNFKEAFTPEFVANAIQETTGPVRHLADPFGGSGTAGLAAQFLGVRPTLIEVNPYLADLIEAKLTQYDIDEVRDCYAWLVDRVFTAKSPRTPSFAGAPKTFIEPGVDGRYVFSKEVARRIVVYRQVIDQLSSPSIRRLFRVILGNIVVAVSNVVISGKGRRYRRDWAARVPQPDTLDGLFRSSTEITVYDIHRYSARPSREYTVIRGDSRTLLQSIDEIDLAVFSPPYPNSFDYTDVYNVELWSLGYLDGPDANLALRKATVRSHVQIAYDIDGTPYPSRRLQNAITKLTNVRQTLWNRRIPEMVSAYFSDMGNVLSALASKLRPKGRIYIVVGDSRYAGVQIPVAKVLVDFAPHVGLSVQRTEPCRSMRVSPQQGGQPGLPETLLVFEKP